MVAGDAAFTCGVSYEALNNVAESTRRLIVVLNDNEWSIAKNVGAYRQLLQPHRHQHHLRTPSRAGCQVRGEARGQARCAEFAGKVEEGMKSLILPERDF